MIREASSDFLRIDISNGKTRKIISACQSDSVHRTVHFLLSNNGTPLDLSNIFSAEILIKRVNNTETDNPCIIDGDDISYTLKSNDISVVGENECHLLLMFSDGSKLETPIFYLNVFNSFYNQAALQSQNEYAVLGQQVLDAKGYADDAAASAEAANESIEITSENAAAAANAVSEAADIKSETADLKSETADYLTSTSEYAASASEYASTAGSNAAVTGSNVDSTSAYLASTSAKASEAAVSASEAANYMTSTSEYMTSASEYASTAGSQAALGSSYMASTSEYASEAGSEASYAGSCANQAEYWYNQAEAIAAGFAGTLFPMGTVTFANLPSLADAQSGWMYNVSDEFTTTSDFQEGSGLTIPAGSNVYKTALGKWDILAGSPVSGVKGNAETNYRRGNVNITPANIGLGNVRNEDIGDTDISSIGATVKAAILALFNKFANYQTKLTNPLTQSDVVDNLTSTSTTSPLSANQGKALKDTIDGLDASDPSADGESVTFIASIAQTNGLISALKKTVSTVAKGTAGLCPALPNETTTQKYLRQDGTWVAPPIATSTSKTGSGTTVTQTIAANTTLDDVVGTLLNNDNALKDKVGTESGTVGSYTTVTIDKLSYDQTNKKIIMKVNGADTPVPFKSGLVFDVALSYYKFLGGNNAQYYWVGFLSNDTDKECPVSTVFNHTSAYSNVSFCGLTLSYAVQSHSFVITYTKACTRYIGTSSQHFNAGQSETIFQAYLNCWWSDSYKGDSAFYVIFD